MIKNNKRLKELLFTAPSWLWLFVFFLIPTVFVIIISFRPADVYGNIGTGWTLEAYRGIWTSDFTKIFFRTLKLSLYTTALCLFFAIPVAYFMGRLEKKWQNMFLVLIMVPFWTNFLIRIYAWKVLLHPQGLLKRFLVFLSLMNPDASLLYNEGSVLLVLIYTYLPFAILPLYASSEKFDFRLMEAGRDLGAGPLKTFFLIYIPNISQGIITAVMVVFIPSLGSYVIPEMVGGPNSEMIGNKIAHRVFIDRNLPKGSAYSVILVLLILLPTVFQLFKHRFGRQEGRKTAGGVPL